MTATAVHLVSSDGGRWPLAVERWLSDVEGLEWELIARLAPPVLDIGCGPGRHVVALAGAGIPVLGIDVSAAALGLARARGVCVLERSVFDPIPAMGRWGSALLLDGNAGIGGDPEALLQRVRALLRPGGQVLVELEGPGVATARLTARLHRGAETSPWFPWARVGTDHIESLAAACQLGVAGICDRGGRWFALLERCGL